MKKIFYIFIFICFALNTFGQRNNTIYFMEQMPQNLSVNPAKTPDYKIFVGVPALSSIYANIDNTGFSFKNLRDDDSPIDGFKPINLFNTDFDIGMINFGFKVKDMYFSLDFNQKMQSQVTYPEDFGIFLWEGNLNNPNLDFTNLGFDMSLYYELAFGFAKDVNDKLRLGGKAKILFGAMNVNTQNNDFTLHTDENTSNWEFNHPDIVINTSTIDLPVTIEKDENGDRGGRNSEITSDLGGSDMMNAMMDNKGFALDFGATYQLNDEISLSASIIDLGFITWNSGVANFEIKNNFAFEGIDFSDIINDDFGDMVDDFIDSIVDVSDIKETNNSYTTMLATKIYIGGTYKVHDNVNFGALTRLKFQKSKIQASLSLSANMLFGNFLSLTTSYNLMNNNYTNFGLGFGLRADAIQIYMITDNVFAGITTQTRNLSLRFGFNLIFGYDNED